MSRPAAMDFLIADTFTESLARLTNEEQKSAKTTAFDLQTNPASPGFRFHRLDKAQDKGFWSVRISGDLRLIVHRAPGSLLLCYVDHHDRAYDWAAHRRLEMHPATGAAQLVVLRERMGDVTKPVPPPQQAAAAPPKPRLFAGLGNEELMAYGVPSEWLAEVQLADEDTLLALAERLPAEAGEALLELATGGRPRPAQPAAPDASPFAHPDARRRFRVVADLAELQRALDSPWDKWTVFLHPAQRELVERDWGGAARVAGSAGTGKTIVALHRAAFLARRNPDARVLLATFSDPLAHALQTRLRRLVGNEPRLAERIDVHSIPALGMRLYRAHCGPARPASRDAVRELLQAALQTVGECRFGLQFLWAEWEQVVDAWQVASWKEYRDVARLGRKTRLPEAQREILWRVFDRVRAAIADRGLLTPPAMFTALAAVLATRSQPVFDFAVVDEAQDISVAQLRLFAALGGQRPNALFFAGDLGQRIFQQPFSWKSLGVDVRGRSRTLRVNYRTSHQIRQRADRLLEPVVTDVDGNADDRSHTVSVYNGPQPLVQRCQSQDEEVKAVAEWLAAQVGAGLLPHECGVFVRSAGQLGRAQAAIGGAGLPFRVLDERVDTGSGHVAVGTMHLAKGLEFRAVAVMACDDEVLPLQERIEGVGDDADLNEVYETERHLLYVACTRAREFLSVSGVEPVSEFVDDLGQ